MNAEDLCFLTATELAPLIEQRKVSPVELVDAQLARIEAMDGVLRAYIHVAADEARAAAKAAEIEIANGGYRGPLHGVTVAHKDILDVRGMPTTAASRLLLDNTATRDATTTGRLRAAGAICTGKLNLIEFASGTMGVYGYGATRGASGPTRAAPARARELRWRPGWSRPPWARTRAAPCEAPPASAAWPGFGRLTAA
jgi:aspartyl-tRNA(Asn)/glutamyl-tRNA(Gln) amidotransferase subunit A